MKSNMPPLSIISPYDISPASGFGQKSGRVGFRTTFLPSDDKLVGAIEGFAKHHKTFCDRYGGLARGSPKKILSKL